MATSYRLEQTSWPRTHAPPLCSQFPSLRGARARCAAGSRVLGRMPSVTLLRVHVLETKCLDHWLPVVQWRKSDCRWFNGERVIAGGSMEKE
eukprot:365684-Chlamydomonas_euryale.AAC.10